MEESKPKFNVGDKDLCKTCCNCWQDLAVWPVKQYVSHCVILDKKEGFVRMDDVVPYPCIECPFNSYNRKN